MITFSLQSLELLMKKLNEISRAVRKILEVET